jgi:glutamyl endopeptidase
MAGESDDAPSARDANWYLNRFPDPDALLDMLGDDPAATLLNAAKSRAVVDPTIDVAALPNDPDAVALVASAAEIVKNLSVKSAAPISDEQRKVLDAVLLIVARPALFVRGGRAINAPPNWPEVEADHALITANLRGVASVVIDNAVCGTAVLVADGVAITNNHVVCVLLGLPMGTWKSSPHIYAEAVANANKKWAQKVDDSRKLDFVREHGATEARTVTIAKIAGTHALADIAVLALTGPVAGARTVPLQAAAPKTLKDRPVYVAGYPVADGANATPLFVLEKVFGQGSTLATKRVSPGKLRTLTSELVLEHDASTLGGSSGSAVFDFETHEMIGLHYAGLYNSTNRAVPIWKLAKDPLMAGIRFSDAT